MLIKGAKVKLKQAYVYGQWVLCVLKLIPWCFGCSGL